MISIRLDFIQAFIESASAIPDVKAKSWKYFLGICRARQDYSIKKLLEKRTSIAKNMNFWRWCSKVILCFDQILWNFLLKITRKDCSFIFGLRKWWARSARLKRTIWKLGCTFWLAQFVFLEGMLRKQKRSLEFISNSGKISEIAFLDFDFTERTGLALSKHSFISGVFELEHYLLQNIYFTISFSRSNKI